VVSGENSWLLTAGPFWTSTTVKSCLTFDVDAPAMKIIRAPMGRRSRKGQVQIWSQSSTTPLAPVQILEEARSTKRLSWHVLEGGDLPVRKQTHNSGGTRFRVRSKKRQDRTRCLFIVRSGGLPLFATTDISPHQFRMVIVCSHCRWIALTHRACTSY
jgi:hypothetical protein